MNCIMKRYSTHGRIPFDEFVSCCVRLRALTGEWAEIFMESDRWHKKQTKKLNAAQQYALNTILTVEETSTDWQLIESFIK